MSRAADAQVVFLAIRHAIPEFFVDHLERRLISGRAWGNTSELRLHSAEEPVEICYTDGGHLEVTAKTSSAGPGYHARLIDFLTFLGSKLGIEWDWRDGEEDAADETGYHGHRDFARLQQEVANLLRGIAKYVLAEKDASNFLLSLPLGMAMRTHHYAASPLGFWSTEWFERISNCDNQKLQARAAEFFPWWSQERDGCFWLNCGLVLCWVDLPWHRSSDEKVIGNYRLALDCFSRARTLDPRLALPNEEIAEIEEILKEGDWDRAPKPEGIGFRRHIMQRDLTGHWTVDLPGYFYENSEQDGETVVYWFGSRTVRGSSGSFHADGPNGSDESHHDNVGGFKNSLQDAGEGFEIRNGHVAGWACETQTDQPNESYWILQGEFSFGNSICFVTITYDDPESDREWALEVMRSVTCPNS